MIKSIDKKPEKHLEIDLTGPQGNAFYILGVAGDLAKKLDLDKDQIISEMTSGDYNNLIEVFEEYFGYFVVLYR